jgi:hypothetical protein
LPADPVTTRSDGAPRPHDEREPPYLLGHRVFGAHLLMRADRAELTRHIIQGVTYGRCLIVRDKFPAALLKLQAAPETSRPEFPGSVTTDLQGRG